MYAQAESVMERLSPVRAEAMSRDQLVAEVEVLRARASQQQVRVEHLEEAREHYRRMNQHHRTEMERALALARKEAKYRRLLAQEWAAAGRKVRGLSKWLERHVLGTEKPYREVAAPALPGTLAK